MVKTSQIEIRNDLRNLSYAGVTKQENTTSSSIELKTEDEKKEERKIKANACNIIVHGVEESTQEEPNELKIEDQKYIENVIMSRLGLKSRAILNIYTANRSVHERKRIKRAIPTIKDLP